MSMKELTEIGKLITELNIKRDILINKLIEEGYSYNQIAIASGFTRQAISNRVNINKEKARQATNRAIRRGELVHPKTCQRCNSDKPLEVHHLDYNDPLKIEWLCKSCHQIETNKSIPDRVIKHGTRYEYLHGCRCKECVEANREYQRLRYREKNKVNVNKYRKV